ncbi:MAG TPA: hypothetical protein VNX68_01205 [Nitrosopumilaceae archaeon]|jgi:hypothetical protein|nr:hypothetical protein [Nitrosopumilaceae archaeon]
MSYEPALIILKKDLDKYKNLFHYGEIKNADSKEDTSEEGLTAMQYIKRVYDQHKTLRIGGVELVVCSPSHTSFNQKVRGKLTELHIEFETHW